jgi:hypothetical protein
MTKEELKEKINELSRQFEEEKNKIYKQYLEEEYSIKIGDIVTDHVHTIKVESIDYFYDCFLHIPTAKLNGPDYKKDGTISKRQTNMPVYSQNIKAINGKKII